jgi:hypothetical protein
MEKENKKKGPPTLISTPSPFFH